MAEPTPELVKQFWLFMTGHYGTQVIDRTRAPEMKAVGWFLDKIGIADKETFKTHYATTIGKRLYLPFNVGVEDNVWGLWEQIVTCVHEHQHVVQYVKDGQKFQLKYLLRPGARAVYEAEAFRCHLELDWWRHKDMPETDDLIELMGAYNLRSVDLAVARKIIKLSRQTIELGGITNEASRLAIKWLDANAPDLKSP